jgi:hypothetical protein
LIAAAVSIFRAFLVHHGTEAVFAAEPFVAVEGTTIQGIFTRVTDTTAKSDHAGAGPVGGDLASAGATLRRGHAVTAGLRAVPRRRQAEACLDVASARATVVVNYTVAPCGSAGPRGPAITAIGLAAIALPAVHGTAVALAAVDVAIDVAGVSDVAVGDVSIGEVAIVWVAVGCVTPIDRVSSVLAFACVGTGIGEGRRGVELPSSVSLPTAVSPSAVTGIGERFAVLCATSTRSRPEAQGDQQHQSLATIPLHDHSSLATEGQAVPL